VQEAFLGDYLHTEVASGAVLFIPEQNQHVIVGNPPAAARQSVEFTEQQLAWVTSSSASVDRYFSVVVHDNRSLLQLQVTYPASQLQAIFSIPAELGQSGELFLADSEGFIIAQSKLSAQQGRTHPVSAAPMQACLRGENTEMLATNSREQAVILGFRFVPEIGGGCIMAHIEQAEAFAPLRKLEKRIVIALALFIILATVMVNLLARRIVRPIIRLTDTARRISNGDHSIRADMAGLDEISELASSFNQMTDALSDAQRNLEAKVAERTQALRLSQERYMLAERAVNDGIWDWNILAHEYYLSPRWNKILGYSEGELPNRESIFFELIHPDDKQHASEMFKRHLENHERYSTEIRLRHKDGSYRWVLDRGEALRDKNGLAVRMIGSITDITERKAAETELISYRDHLEERVAMATTEVQAIVKTAVNGVISIDASGAIRVFNPAAERLFGWQASEVLGKNVSILMPEPFATEHDRYIQRFLDTQQGKILGIEREVVAQRKDGTLFPANLAVGHGIISDDRHIFVGFIADISLQKQAEQELRQAKEAAEAAAKAKANFLANMSHEIRTPMNTVIGFAEVVLQKHDLSKESREHIGIILSSARHLLNVINDILDFSKIEAGKVELESVCFSLPAAMQETLQTIGLRATEKGLKLDLQIDPALPEFFSGDPNRLRQVVLNLVGNAVKFTEAGQIIVSIEKADGDAMVHFAISDTGIGMTPEQTEKIFESFSQADTTTSRRFGGTGLGTTISKQIVEMMGGRIWVDSQLGEGATFHFTIHLPATDQHESCLYVQKQPPQTDFRSPRQFTVLLAEDIEANANLARLRLEQQGHQVYWVKNGQQAVDAFTNGGIDLILMDLQMPVLDGLEATRQIRQLEQGTGRRMPILALTASVLKHEKLQCTEAGMDAIVGKPIDINELLEKMELLTPPGLGQMRPRIDMPLQPELNLDFSVLSAVADTDKGLHTWQDPQVYLSALRSFAEQHADDATRMMNCYAQNPADVRALEQLAHALKGLAGNLALTQVAESAIKLDDLLKNQPLPQLQTAFAGLEKSLAETVAAIKQLPEADVQQCTAPHLDQQQLIDLLQALLLALDSLNPDNAEPIMRQIGSGLQATEMKSLRQALDSFDFDTAKAEVQKLITGLVNQTKQERT
jgi:PAS domain S-box-containing protein